MYCPIACGILLCGFEIDTKIMSEFITYLTFDGNCREAMSFYRQCFGGEVSIQTVGESPLSEKFPEEMKEYVVQATLINGRILLMGTDMVDEQGLTKGNATSVLVNCESEEKLWVYYHNLSSGGSQYQPVKKNYWGAMFGGVTDRYGNHWLLNFGNR